LEELLPKDNEEVPLFISTTDEPADSTLSPFAPDQLVRCDECLRANPPTRVNCLYCSALLPQNETTVNLQKPTLRPLEKWEQGYNNILLPPVANLTDEKLAAASDLLRLRPDDLGRILSAQIPLPLARAATADEARLIQRRLQMLEINSSIMPDADLHIDSADVLKIRSLEIDDAGVYAYQSPEAPAIQISWSDFALLVSGRLIFKRVELIEKKGARADSILDASEFVTDETVVDVYIRQHSTPYRITANSFDFSCLGPRKGLLATENISTLVQLFRQQAPQARQDDSFNSLRKSLEAVWPSEQQTESSGWRRERPGKYNVGSITGVNNEMQFLRYSKFRYHLQITAASSEETSSIPGASG
jgi:hypothetical protein